MESDPSVEVTRITKAFVENAKSHPASVSKLKREIAKICESGLTAASINIGWNERTSVFCKKLGRLLLIADVIIAENDSIALADSAQKFQRHVERLGGGWMPVPCATDANRYEDTYRVALFNRTILDECVRYALSHIPIVYIPTTDTKTYTTWDISLQSEGFDGIAAWREAVRRSDLFSRSMLPDMPQERVLSESPRFLPENPPVLNFQLPVFDEFSPEEVQKAIRDHPDAYLRFRIEFRKILHAVQSAQNRGDAHEVNLIRSEYLYDEVIRLNQQYKRIQKGVKKSLVSDTVTLVGFSVLALTNQDLIQLLTSAGVLYKARDLVNSYLQSESERLKMEESRLFWFWNLLRSKNIPIGRLKT